MFEKLEKILTEYTQLSIFSKSEFRRLAIFEWGTKFTSVTNANGTYTTHKEVLENVKGTFFPSASITVNPFEVTSEYLSGIQREERQQARSFIRKVFLENDGCSIEKAVKEIFSYDNEIIDWIMKWIDGEWCFGISVATTNLPENFLIKRLHKKTNITAEYLDNTGSLSPMDLYMLYIYGYLIHEDDEKRVLYNICIEELGEKFHALIDMQMMIICEIATNIILPCIKGYNKWLEEQLR